MPQSPRPSLPLHGCTSLQPHQCCSCCIPSLRPGSSRPSGRRSWLSDPACVCCGSSPGRFLLCHDAEVLSMLGTVQVSSEAQKQFYCARLRYRCVQRCHPQEGFTHTSGQEKAPRVCSVPAGPAWPGSSGAGAEQRGHETSPCIAPRSWCRAADRCACNLFPVPPQSIVDIAVTFPPPSNMPPRCQRPQQSRQCGDQAVTAGLSLLLHGAGRVRDARCPAKGFGCTLGIRSFKAGRLSATCFQGLHLIFNSSFFRVPFLLFEEERLQISARAQSSLRAGLGTSRGAPS